MRVRFIHHCKRWAPAGLLFLTLTAPASARTVKVRAAIIQFTERYPDETLRDTARLEAQIRKAARHGAKIIVAPENCLYRYSPWTQNGVTMRNLANQSRKLIARFSALAARLKVCIVFGLREPAGSSQTYQSAVFINRDGSLLKKYRKYFPSFAELNYTRAGRPDPRPFETPYGRAWMQICKDMDGNYYVETMPRNISMLIGINKDPSHGWYKVQAGAIRARCWGIGANWGVGGNSGFVSPGGRVVAAVGPGQTITYATLSLSRPDLWWDAYEPDNPRSRAKTLRNGRTQRRNIHAAGNEDWARFKVGGAGARNVNILTSGTSGDTQLWLFQSNGRLVAYNNDGGRGRFSRIRQSSLPAGTYYIRVRENGNNGRIGAYTLRASWSPAPIRPDNYEPDDTRSAAKKLHNGPRQWHTIHRAGNVDWAKFTIGRRGARNVRIETAGRSGNTQLYLYNRAGRRLRADSNSGVGNFSRITLSSLAAGTYYVKVQEYGNNSRILSYTLKATWTNR